MSSSTTSTRPPPSKKAEDAGPPVFFHLRAHIDLNHYNLPKHGPTPDFILDAHSRLTDIVRALKLPQEWEPSKSQDTYFISGSSETSPGYYEARFEIIVKKVSDLFARISHSNAHDGLVAQGLIEKTQSIFHTLLPKQLQEAHRCVTSRDPRTCNHLNVESTVSP